MKERNMRETSGRIDYNSFVVTTDIFVDYTYRF